MQMNNLLFIVGAITMFISGLGANLEIDLKKIIALSTLRQLGLMMIILGLGFYELSFFHLIAHAIFKSLLFLCAGVFIHAIGDIQDIRLAGCINICLPVSSFYFIAASISLCGFPFLTGFYSKDLILETYFIGTMNSCLYILIYTSTIFTLTYSVRLLFYLYYAALGGKRVFSSEEEIGMLVPISLLFILSVVWGRWAGSVLIPVQIIILPFLIKLGILLGLIILFTLVIIIIKSTSVKILRFSKLVKRFTGSM